MRMRENDEGEERGGCHECTEAAHGGLWLHRQAHGCADEAATTRTRFNCPEVFLSRTDVCGAWPKFVLFTIRVVDGHAHWQLEKRYSDFAALDSSLRKKYKGVTSMPPFPSLGHVWTDWARTSGSFTKKLQQVVFNIDPAFVARQRQALQDYLRLLLQHDWFLHCDEMLIFLKDPDCRVPELEARLETAHMRSRHKDEDAGWQRQCC